MMIEGRRKKPSMSVETESVSDKKNSLPPFPLFTRPSTIPSPLSSQSNPAEETKKAPSQKAEEGIAEQIM